MKFLEILCIFVIIVAIALIIKKTVCDIESKTVETYIDPIWPNKVSMYNDYYTRSNGSIYGNSCQPWDMFSGYPLYPKAY
jgi:hypothetical protein